jgi:hemerythrin-like domain-containing protein
VAKQNRIARSGKKSAKAARNPRKATPRKRAVKTAAAKTVPRKTKTARRKTSARAVSSRSTKGPTGSTKRPTGAAAQSSGVVVTVAQMVGGTVGRVVQRVAGSLPWSADENDPLALLETDHRRFEDLLKQGEDTTERAVKQRTRLLDTLTAELKVHELIEEKVLYPALKPHAEARDIVLEGYQEHHVADLLVKELHQLARDNEQWGAKFKVLTESLEHHIEEEESHMFPSARQVLTREELQGLGARMRAMKQDAERSSRFNQRKR